MRVRSSLSKKNIEKLKEYFIKKNVIIKPVSKATK